MKRPALLIAVSLAANVALAGCLVWRLFLSPAPSASAPASAVPSAGPVRPAPSAHDFAAAFQNNDLAALHALLQRSGFPDDLVREIVQSRLRQNLFARMRALHPRPQTEAAWWKQRDWSARADPAAARAQRDLFRQLEHEAGQEELRILGPAPVPADDEYGVHPLAFLAAEKRLQIQKIEADYEELQREVRDEAEDFSMPSDRAKLRLLEQEKKRDILALMTPEEQKAYDLRMSPTAERLRWEINKFDVSEAEYVRIFALQKAFDDKYQGDDPFSSAYDEDQPKPAWSPEEREAEERTLKQRIRALVGEERYLRALKEEDNDYTQLQAAARRFDLPDGTPDRIYGLRETVAASSRQIVDNPSLSAETKKQALADLALRTRQQVRAGLGRDAAEAYLKQGMNWLQTLQEGEAITFSPENSGWDTYRPAESPRAPVISEP